MNYVQTVDVVFLEPVKNKRGTTWGYRLSGKPYGMSQRLQPFLHPQQTKHAFTVGVPLGVANPWAVAGATGVFGRAVRLRVSRSFRAFCTLLDRMVR